MPLLALALALVPASGASAAAGQLYGFGENSAGQLASTVGNGSETANPTPALITLPAVERAGRADGGGRPLHAGAERLGPALRVRRQPLRAARRGERQRRAGAQPGAGAAHPAGRGRSRRPLAAGSTHSLVLTSTGELYTFGENQFGQLGRAANSGTENANRVPERISLPGAAAKSCRSRQASNRASR